MSPVDNYGAFVKDPTRRDILLFNISTKDAAGNAVTLRWSRGRYVSGPADSPADTLWEPRVTESGVDYESPQFDPFGASYGIVPSRASGAMVALQIDGDLDALRAYRWPGSTVEVLHGGYTSDGGWLPLAYWRRINEAEIDGWPTWELDRVSFPLRSKEARFDALAERRKLAALGFCLEGNGAGVGVSFNPDNQGVHLRGNRDGVVSSVSSDNLTAYLPEGVQDGDLLLLFVGTHNQNGGASYDDWTVATPSGWTLLQAEAGGADVAHRCYAFWRVANSEPVSYLLSGSGTKCNRVWSCSAWYGVHGSTPVPTSAKGNSGSAGSSAVAPTVTTPNAGDVLVCGWATANGDLNADPTGMTRLTNREKHTPIPGRRASLKVCYERRAAAGATGTRTITVQASRYAAISVVVGNRPSGGDLNKLKLLNSMTVQTAFIPFSIGSAMRLGGWETTPFALGIDSSGHLTWSWKKATATVTKTSAFTFAAEHRYHVEVVHTDTLVTFRIYDWLADTETVQEFAGTGFNGRDTAGGGDEYALQYNDNGGSPGSYLDAQLWTWRVWSSAQDEDDLTERRMRRLTDAEKSDTALVHYVSLDEGIGDRAGDLSLAPADGVITYPATGVMDISATAGSPGYLTRMDAENWADHGFAPGDLVVIAGADANNGRWQVLSLSADKMYLEGTGDLEDAANKGTESVTVDPWRSTLTGAEEQIGAQVPAVYGGPVEGWPGLMVSSATDGVFFMVHPGPVESLDAVQEGGADRARDRDFTEYRRFLALAPAPGLFSTYIGAVGTFYRVGVEPVLPSTCTVRGDANGGYVSTAADVARRILTSCGEERVVDPTELDTDSIDALNAVAPHDVGTGVGDGETITDLVRRVLGTVGAVCWQLRDGRFRMQRFEAPTTASTHLHRKVIQRGSLAPEEVPLPASSGVVQFRRNWTPLNRDQLSEAVESPLRRQFCMLDWRKLTGRRPGVSSRYPRSRDLEPIEAYFCGEGAWHHAAVELNRQLGLYVTPAQVLTVAIRPVTFALDFLETVTLSVQDLDADGVLRDRLGTTASTEFVVVWVQERAKDGLTRLKLWRPDFTEGA